MLAGGCRKNVTKLDAAYTGNWSENEYAVKYDCRLSITIDADGDAVSSSRSQVSDCRRYPTHKGKAKANKKTLRIGLKVYQLNEPPTFIDTLKVRTDFGEGKTNMRMIVDNIVLYKLIKQ